MLNPQLLQGRKLPKWEPRSRREVFVGLNHVHSSDVPLVLITKTGHISPQYHLVFDNTFSPVPSLKLEEDPPAFWNVLDLDEFIHTVPNNTNQVYLEDEWLIPGEIKEEERYKLIYQQLGEHNRKTSHWTRDQRSK